MRGALPNVPRLRDKSGPVPLQHYRLALNMTQRRLAEEIHVRPGTIGCLERGEAKPTTGTAQALADYFGVEVGRLFPDGCSNMPSRRWSCKLDDTLYRPEPEPPTFTHALPRGDFRVVCSKCRTMMTMRAESRSSHDPYCPACGMNINNIVPYGEAAQT